MADVPALNDTQKRALQALIRPAGGAIEGFDNVSDGDLGLRPPILRIGYRPRRSDTWKEGDLRLGQQTAPKATVVFLKVRKFRELREGEEDKRKVSCISTDAVVPDDGVPNPKSPTCAECPYSRPDVDPTGQQRGAPCHQGIAFLGVWVDKGHLPFWLPSSKGTIVEIREALQGFRTWNANHQDEPIRGFYDMKVVLESVEKSSPGRRWFTLKFSPTRMEPGDAVLYKAMYEHVKGLEYVPFLEGMEDKAEPVAQPAGNGATDDSSVPF